MYGGDAYHYVDIGECILPISKKMYKVEKGYYEEKNYTGSYINPRGIVIEEKNKDTEQTTAKTKKMLHLDKQMIISSFQTFTNNSKINNNTLIYLDKHILLVSNYSFNELLYMLSYCKRTLE